MGRRVQDRVIAHADVSCDVFYFRGVSGRQLVWKSECIYGEDLKADCRFLRVLSTARFCEQGGIVVYC